MAGKATEAKHRGLRQVMMLTHGLLLMGVPNLGLRHEQLNTVVKGRANKGFINDLLVQLDGEASQFLSYLTREFADLDRRRQPPFEIVSYYETKTSATAVVCITPTSRIVDVGTNLEKQVAGSGKIVIEGPKELMVTRMSAERVSHLSRDIDHLPGHTDHRGLVRFEHAQDERYLSLIEKLGKMSVAAASCTDPRSSLFFGEATRSDLEMNAEQSDTSQGLRIETLLRVAASEGSTETVRSLIDIGADPNTRTVSYGGPLRAAASKGHDGAAEVLLQKGADVDATDSGGKPALHCALEGAHAPIVQRLLHAGASITLADRKGDSACDYAARVGWAHISKMVHDIDARNPADSGMLLLHVAAYLGKKDDIFAILEQDKKQINVADRRGATALHWAAGSIYGNKDICLLLLDAGADCNLACRSWGTPMHCAVFSGHYKAVQIMLEKGANADVRKELGSWTCLQLAALARHKKIVSLLLSYGANTELRNSRGQTAEDVAVSMRFIDLKSLLQDNGHFV